MKILRTVHAGLMLLGALSGVAAAGELVVEEIGLERGLVAARVRLEDAFDAETRASLASGLPITVRFSTELWRERKRWWDAQVDARVLSYRIRWDPGERAYTLTHPGPPRRDTYEDLDPLLADLTRRVLPAHPRWGLEERHRYYLDLEAAIRPLTLEEFRELDGWIGGQIRGRTDEEEAQGASGGIAQTFFDLLVDFSGFGDVIFEARTPAFRPSELLPLGER